MNFMSKLGVSLEDNNSNKRKMSGVLDKIVSIIAIAMSCYHIYTAIFGTPEWLVHRPLHVAFYLVIGFLTYKSSKKRDTAAGVIRDIILALSAAFVYIYIMMNFERFSLYQFPMTKLVAMDFVVIFLLFYCVVEMTRRTTGWALIIVAAVFMCHTLFARYFPGFLNGPGVQWKNYFSYMFLTSDGLFGSTVNVSASYVFLFVVFGVFLS